MIQHKMAVYETMAQILREAVEVFENEQIPREYDDVAPSTQHEETQHELLETTQSESFEFFYPDRPLSKQHGDIALSYICYQLYSKIVLKSLTT